MYPGSRGYRDIDQSTGADDIPRRADWVQEFIALERVILNALDKLVQLESSCFRAGANGVMLMQAFRDVRKSLQQTLSIYKRHARESYGYRVPMNYTFRDCKDGPTVDRYKETLTDLRNSFKRLRDELVSFLTVYYNISLHTTVEGIKNDLGHWIDDDTNSPGRESFERASILLVPRIGQLVLDLHEFIINGMSSIVTDQTNDLNRYHNITTVATFLAGVTATILQFTYEKNGSAIAIAVNTALFASIVLSMASVSSSLMVVAWKRTCIRPPESVLPRTLANTLTKGPSFYLTVSGMLFTLAVCLFSLSSSQKPVTYMLVLCIASAHTLFVALVYACFNSERWRFRNSMGDKGKILTDSSVIMAAIEFVHNPSRNGDHSKYVGDPPLAKVDLHPRAKIRQATQMSSSMGNSPVPAVGKSVYYPYYPYVSAPTQPQAALPQSRNTIGNITKDSIAVHFDSQMPVSSYWEYQG